MTQYRTVTRANLRNEASAEAAVITTLATGTIVNVDTDRTPDGDWLPVVLVRGWVHQSVVEAVE